MNNWYPVKDWEGLYEINKNGDVRNAKTKKLIVGDINNCGYYRVALYNQGQGKKYFRHRLVAEHFLDKPEGKDFVNHINGDKSNNSLENLEWVSQSENEKHAFANGLKQKTNKPFIIEFVNGEIKQYETIWRSKHISGYRRWKLCCCSNRFLYISRLSFPLG